MGYNTKSYSLELNCNRKNVKKKKMSKRKKRKILKKVK